MLVPLSWLKEYVDIEGGVDCRLLGDDLSDPLSDTFDALETDDGPLLTVDIAVGDTDDVVEVLVLSLLRLIVLLCHLYSSVNVPRGDVPKCQDLTGRHSQFSSLGWVLSLRDSDDCIILYKGYPRPYKTRAGPHGRWIVPKAGFEPANSYENRS